MNEELKEEIERMKHENYWWEFVDECAEGHRRFSSFILSNINAESPFGTLWYSIERHMESFADDLEGEGLSEDEIDNILKEIDAVREKVFQQIKGVF